ncbi:MAG: hypothetical protein U0359_16695 [Byssovorax sp.]
MRRAWREIEQAEEAGESSLPGGCGGAVWRCLLGEEGGDVGGAPWDEDLVAEDLPGARDLDKIDSTMLVGLAEVLKERKR